MITINGSRIASEYWNQHFKLEGFEHLIDRKFNCKDCIKYDICLKWRIEIMKNNWFGCDGFFLSDETKVLIKRKDIEIEKTKIDTHPRLHITTLQLIKYNNIWRKLKQVFRLNLIL